MISVMSTVPTIAGNTPPSALAARGSAVRNSFQRLRYTFALSPSDRALAGYARTICCTAISFSRPSAVRKVIP